MVALYSHECCNLCLRYHQWLHCIVLVMSVVICVCVVTRLTCLQLDVTKGKEIEAAAALIELSVGEEGENSSPVLHGLYILCQFLSLSLPVCC